MKIIIYLLLDFYHPFMLIQIQLAIKSQILIIYNAHDKIELSHYTMMIYEPMLRLNDQ